MSRTLPELDLNVSYLDYLNNGKKTLDNPKIENQRHAGLPYAERYAISPLERQSVPSTDSATTKKEWQVQEPQRLPPHQVESPR